MSHERNSGGALPGERGALRRRSPLLRTVVLLTVIALAPLAGLADPVAGGDTGKVAGDRPAARVAADYGIELAALRSSANGYVIDFRYKVLDPDKAAVLVQKENKPYLIDQATGARLLVPNTPKLGPLRQTAQKPSAGKVYFALFSNPGKVVKPGNKVTVVIGDFRAKDLVVQ